MSEPMATDFDVVVVGAGLSGVAAAHYLKRDCPRERFVVLEGRDAIGGTWDLFRYPGVRSDSDMFTLGYSFRPWGSDTLIAPGPAIRNYVQETAEAEGLLPQIRFRQRVQAARWDSAQARWTVDVRTDQGLVHYTCRFLFFCSGYYDYAQGYAPQWPGREAFRGRIVHPQHWPEDLDYAGQRVVVVGSGATAVTLLPAMAGRAAHVTMLQRSPSYILAVPGSDRLGKALKAVLPRRLAYRLIRWKNIALSAALYQFSRRRPGPTRDWLVREAQAQAGPGVEPRHLEPRYQPWDQRMCFVPDADLFRALRSGRASIATDEIRAFTPDGLQLASGAHLPADIVVTATGLNVQMFGGATLEVDGQPVNIGEAVAYKGMMLSGVPNLAMAMGYTNASWTLRCELAAQQVCRILNHLRRDALDVCVPQPDAPIVDTAPAIDLSSGYIQRAARTLPRQGPRKPWRIYQNYLLDLLSLKLAPVTDGVLRFGRRGEAPR